MYRVIRHCNLQTLLQLRPQNLIGKREDCGHELDVTANVIRVYLHVAFHVSSIYTSFESESSREEKQPTSVNKSQH